MWQTNVHTREQRTESFAVKVMPAACELQRQRLKCTGDASVQQTTAAHHN